MPVFPNRVPDLQHVGPIIEVVVFPPQPIVIKLRLEGKPVPSRKLIALIDTGASRSCIDDVIASDLGLTARDVILVQTPSGESQQFVYDLGFRMPGLQSNVISIMAIGANLTKQPYDALIGRDILKLCTLIYNGWDNSYQLHI
jgi:hypothetical protein